MSVEEIELYDACLIYLAQDRDEWRALVYVWECVKFLSCVRAY